MTKKRFRLGYAWGDYGLIDNDEWIDLHPMSENSEKNVQICINKMNELAEVNRQLNECNQKLNEEVCILQMDLCKTKSYEQLEKENKRLKWRVLKMTERFIIPDGDLDTDVTLIDTSTGIEYEDNFKDIVDLMNTLYDVEEDLLKENKDLREQLILANAFIKMIENCYEDASIEDILYMKYGEFQEELHLQMAIAKEELEE